MSKRRKWGIIIFNWLLVFIIMGIIFFFSGQDGDLSGSTSNNISELIYNTFHLNKFILFNDFHFLIRKLAHFSIYFVLGVSSFNAFFITKDSKYYRTLLCTILLVALYAFTDEFHQAFIDGRSSELRDVIIDISGGSIGGMIYYLFLKVRYGRYDI